MVLEAENFKIKVPGDLCLVRTNILHLCYFLLGFRKDQI